MRVFASRHSSITPATSTSGTRTTSSSSSLRARLTRLEAGREEEMQLLVGEAGRREERRQHFPIATAKPGLLDQLPLRSLEWRFTPVDEPGRELEYRRVDRHAVLAHQGDLVAPVDRHDRGDRSVDDDVAALSVLDAEDRPLVQRHRQDPDG